MSRINTNVSSLVAQTTLSRTQDQLQTSLTRLSTGLRINSGKDDPAGLIASENLRRDITSANTAITNSQQAGQLIATADSSLGQISNLLNTIRGLAVQAANSGVLSDDQVAANQLQVDSSLDAIDRIAKVTTFQGRKLLDGTLDFTKAYTSGGSTVSDLQINQASLGTSGSLAVNVNITSAATQGTLADTGFAGGSPTQASGTLDLGGTGGFLQIAATAGHAADGGVGNSTAVTFQAAGDIAQAFQSVGLTNSTAAIHVAAAAGGAADGVTGNTTAVNFAAAGNIVQAHHDFTLTNSSDDINVAAVAGAANDGTAGNVNVVFQADSGIAQATGHLDLSASNGGIIINAKAGDEADGANGNVKVIIAVNGSPGATTATFDASTKTITVGVNSGGDTLSGIAAKIAAINGGADFSTSAVNGGNTYDGADDLTYNGVGIGGSDGATSATLASGTITVKVALHDTVASVANAIQGVGGGGKFTALATTGTGEFDTGDLGTSNGALASGSNGTTTATYNSGTNTITAHVAIGDTVDNVAAQINGLADFTANVTAGTGHTFATTDLSTTATLGNGANGTTNASYDATTNTITAKVALGDSLTQVATAIDSLADFSANATSGGGNTFSSSDFGTQSGKLSGGAGTGLAADLVVRIAGSKGSEVFNFKAGATVDQVVNAVNLLTDGTGVQATNNAGNLSLKSSDYGSAATVDVEVLSEGNNGTFATGLSGTHATGTDVAGTINGTTANGKGNTLSINSTSLDFSLTVTNGSTTAVSFNINGGGAVFQLGPNVVTNQQARIGISGVSTGTLGGTDGRLYELRSGYGKDLSSDPNGATLIVDEAINKVTSLRGRLGAFQSTTIDTNVAALKDTVTNLTEAQSQIRDADFAAETANLTRAQVLVQSGTQVLSIANQQPQNVLALLRNLQ
ncbi:MAG TPA: flagellin [Pirellulaceae bacterium]|jgi:flagellin